MEQMTQNELSEQQSTSLYFAVHYFDFYGE